MSLEPTDPRKQRNIYKGVHSEIKSHVVHVIDSREKLPEIEETSMRGSTKSDDDDVQIIEKPKASIKSLIKPFVQPLVSKASDLKMMD